MKTVFAKLLLISLCVVGSGFSQETGQSYIEFEKARFLKTSENNNAKYLGDSSFDVGYYKLDLNISYSPQSLSGIVTVSARSLGDILTSVFLDLSDALSVDSVLSNNLSCQYSHSENKLIISLDKPYSPDEIFTLTIFYHGVPVTTGLRSFVFDSHNEQPSIWTLSEPYGASDWWPCKDTPEDKVDSSDVWITVPDNLIAVSNGTLTDEIDNGNGTKTYKWKNSYPIANYLISLAISNYSVYKNYFRYSNNDSMLVIHYIYPEDLNELKPQLDKTTGMLELFSELFGEYPFIKEKYGHAQFGSGGMEHQTITSIGIFTDGVIAHELTHQWFGDKITCRNWENIWLNEGFATYGEGLYYEFSEDKSAYNSFLSYHINRSKAAVGSIYVEDVSSISEIFNGNRSYSKGAIVLHMLRGIVGDSVFFNILKNYLNDPFLAYRTATTEDFERVAEETSGLQLNYFFNQWIYGKNYPKYNLEWDFQQAADNMYDVNINIEQSVNTYPQFFTMPVKIKISTSVGDTILSLFNDAQNQKSSFRISGKPTQLTFDPNNFILKDLIISDPAVLLPQLNLEQNYPNPFNNSTVIGYTLPQEDFVTLKVYNSLGQQIATLFNENGRAGEYKINFDGSSFGSGIYFYRIAFGKRIITKKMLLLK